MKARYLRELQSGLKMKMVFLEIGKNKKDFWKLKFYLNQD